MVRKFPTFRSERKITVPFDFQPKFPDFWLNGNHPSLGVHMGPVQFVPAFSVGQKIASEWDWIGSMDSGIHVNEESEVWTKSIWTRINSLHVNTCRDQCFSAGIICPRR